MRAITGKFRAAWALTFALLLMVPLAPGCVTVGPDYAPPKAEMPAKWSGKAPTAELKPQDRQSLAQWWSLFKDPILNDLIERALANNLSLKQAKSRVREVRAKRRMAKGSLYPGVSLSGSGSLSQSRDDSYTWYDRESYSAGMGVSWEADIFGGNKRSVEAAQADYQASQEDLRDVLVSLTAETATAYINLRTYQQRLAMAQDNLKLQEETRELTKIKFQTGMAGALDLEQADYNLESTRSQLSTLQAGIEEMKNNLAVLLGAWPGDLNAELSQAAPIPHSSIISALGVPADLVRRRPDIRAAERRLAAQTARIGVAESELYPKLTLNGSFGLEALAIGSLISPASMVAALGAGASWSIFNQESIRGNIEVQNALQEQALLEYQAVLRSAVQEVENSYNGLWFETGKQASLKKASGSAQRAAGLALQGYENGLSDFQNVLETQKSLTSFKDKLAQSQGQTALNLITLYKALGGGWSASALASTKTN